MQLFKHVPQELRMPWDPVKLVVSQSDRAPCRVLQLFKLVRQELRIIGSLQMARHLFKHVRQELRILGSLQMALHLHSPVPQELRTKSHPAMLVVC